MHPNNEIDKKCTIILSKNFNQQKHVCVVFNKYDISKLHKYYERFKAFPFFLIKIQLYVQ